MVSIYATTEDTRVQSLGREGNGNPLQYSCLENPTDTGAWRATVHGTTKGSLFARNTQDLI